MQCEISKQQYKNLMKSRRGRWMVSCSTISVLPNGDLLLNVPNRCLCDRERLNEYKIEQILGHYATDMVYYNFDNHALTAFGQSSLVSVNEYPMLKLFKFIFDTCMAPEYELVAGLTMNAHISRYPGRGNGVQNISSDWNSGAIVGTIIRRDCNTGKLDRSAPLWVGIDLYLNSDTAASRAMGEFVYECVVNSEFRNALFTEQRFKTR